MLVLILFLVVAVLAVIQYLHYLRSIAFSVKIPTVLPPYPLVGNIPSFLGKSSKQAFWIIHKCFSKVDRFGKLVVGPVVILVNHPELIQQILEKDCLYDKPFFFDFAGMPNGMISDRNGKRWLRRRKILNPTFNTPVLAGFLPIMDEQVKEMTMDLRSVADGQTEIDLHKYVFKCTMKVVLSTTMGRDVMKLPGLEDYQMHIDVIANVIGERVANCQQYLDILYRMTSSYKSQKASEVYCNAFTNKIIRERKQELREVRNTTSDDDEFHTKSLNFLDQVLTIQREDETEFSDQVILENVFSVIGAGAETSAVSTSNACLFLAMYPEIQAKVFAEINDVFYSDEVEVTLTTLKQLVYTEQVIKEILRLFPPAPLIGRETTNDDLVLDGIRIPKNQIIAINFYTVHRREDYWGPDPERFDPDRFNPETFDSKRNTSAYFPFSTGMRNCIGWRYSMNLIRILLVRILQEYEIKTNLKQSQLRFKFEISLRLVGPHSVWLTKRDKSQRNTL